MSHVNPGPSSRVPPDQPPPDEKLRWFATRIEWQVELLTNIRSSLWIGNIWLAGIAICSAINTLLLFSLLVR